VVSLTLSCSAQSTLEENHDISESSVSIKAIVKKMSPSRIEDQATCLTLRQYSTGTVFKSLLAHSLYTPSFLGALAKFRKATITFVTSVCLHMLPDLTLNFTCNFFCNDLIFYLTVRVIARCVRQYDKTNTDKTHPSPGSQALLVSPHKSARSDA